MPDPAAAPKVPRWVAPRLPRWVIGLIALDAALAVGLSFAGSATGVLALVGLIRFVAFLAAIAWVIGRLVARRHDVEPGSLTVRDDEPAIPSAAHAARQRLWK